MTDLCRKGGRVCQLNQAGSLQSCTFNHLQETFRNIRHACTFAFAPDNNPLNDGKQRGTGRSNDEANEKGLSNSGKLLQKERCERVQAKEEKEQRASEQITEVYEYMTGETGMTNMKKDGVVRDKEIVFTVMEKQKLARQRKSMSEDEIMLWRECDAH